MEVMCSCHAMSYRMAHFALKCNKTNYTLSDHVCEFILENFSHWSLKGCLPAWRWLSEVLVRGIAQEDRTYTCMYWFQYKCCKYRDRDRDRAQCDTLHTCPSGESALGCWAPEGWVWSFTLLHLRLEGFTKYLGRLQAGNWLSWSSHVCETCCPILGHWRHSKYLPDATIGGWLFIFL